jgi:CheY-like chemotaxis protein/HPt (histidine-containing phosphotransfer) domain-containing protein
MQMPDMDGIELARAIRGVPTARDLPLIMLTSLGRRDPGVDEMGFAAFLNKPIKSAALHDALRLALTGQGAPLPRSRSASETVLDAGLADRHPLSILVAEDYAINQKVALHTLARMGYRADIACNGLEALEALRRQPYDVVLMDVQMPEMDGLEATRHILREWPPEDRPRIIAMTAHALQGDREICLEAGMDDYVTKPVQAVLLQAALMRCARRAGPSPALDRATLLEFFPDLARGDTAMFAEMAGMLLEDVPPRLEELAVAVAAGQAAPVHRIAHTLKSGSRSFGALIFAGYCEELESAARGGALPDAAAVARLRAEFDRVTEAVRREMET